MVYKAGVKFICNLTSAYVEVIREMVDDIVGTFQAFVAWAIEFIESTIDVVLGSIIDDDASK